MDATIIPYINTEWVEEVRLRKKERKKERRKERKKVIYTCPNVTFKYKALLVRHIISVGLSVNE